MTSGDYYRAQAKAEWDAAAQATLPTRRAVHERSAEAWEEMAERAEDTAAKATVNAAAKNAHERPLSGSHKGWGR